MTQEDNEGTFKGISGSQFTERRGPAVAQSKPRALWPKPQMSALEGPSFSESCIRVMTELSIASIHFSRVLAREQRDPLLKELIWDAFG